ncbi:LysM peptidoglycan-binding domain-containing protein [Stigmatella sp. ncwal1]|uniref:LysM peptidoglycan-binding domain-containing protein n=1 Tax=Stigmatella ashevillensis TaxID=2995309 RepID=A0ABT5D786_9BACT|nr:LysM peptidoglycan-binding domain-containing protein [Stigmatella ashevillena]MDC0709523.1 LysM peptidoglycan-binding domain-containing protein [Stigmatella ashevillena]
MRNALLLVAYLSATPSTTEVVVGERESLAQIAERLLGDPKGASELMALNGLTSDAVPPGTVLKLPPEADRTKALGALAAARQAVAQTSSEPTRREEASAKLQEAEAHFQAAHYLSAAQAADGASRLLSPQPVASHSTFQVSVDAEGATTVSVHTGPPVRVTAEEVTRPVNPGEVVRVEKGQPPPVPRRPMAAPALRKPEEGARIKLVPARGKLGPVTLSWTAVQGATGYGVEVLSAQGEPVHQKTVAAPQQLLELPPLPAGRYRWTVRALGEGQKPATSSERLFELVEDAVKLRVGSPAWK